jgi:nucleoside-diphosphate kinase
MNKERTLILLKPDSVARGIVGEVLTRYERVGLKIVAMKMLFATDKQLEEHYYKDDEWLIEKGKGIIKNKGYKADYDPKKAGKEITDGLVTDMKLSPIIAMVLQGHNAVEVVRKITGPTNIKDAPPGTIRGDYSHDTYALANISDRPIITIVHASGAIDEAKKEIDIWFKPNEIFEYTKPHDNLHYRGLK